MYVNFHRVFIIRYFKALKYPNPSPPMNYTIPCRSINLTRSEKEMNNDSRNRKGYHTYVSHFFSDLKLLSKEEQEAVLVDNSIWDDTDDVTVDIVMTPHTVKSYKILEAASISW